jgi:hypothetical protein
VPAERSGRGCLRDLSQMRGACPWLYFPVRATQRRRFCHCSESASGHAQLGTRRFPLAGYELDTRYLASGGFGIVQSFYIWPKDSKPLPCAYFAGGFIVT